MRLHRGAGVSATAVYVKQDEMSNSIAKHRHANNFKLLFMANPPIDFGFRQKKHTVSPCNRMRLFCRYVLEWTRQRCVGSGCRDLSVMIISRREKLVKGLLRSSEEAILDLPLALKFSLIAGRRGAAPYGRGGRSNPPQRGRIGADRI